MKKATQLIVLFLLGASSLQAQFGISFHQSNLPFIDFHYSLLEEQRLDIGLRLGVDNFVEDLPLEVALTYDVVAEDYFRTYIGGGLRVNVFEGLVIPAGIKVYPFEKVPGLGFHIELAPIVITDDVDADLILRGSWGIRYEIGR